MYVDVGRDRSCFPGPQLRRDHRHVHPHLRLDRRRGRPPRRRGGRVGRRRPRRGHLRRHVRLVLPDGLRRHHRLHRLRRPRRAGQDVVLLPLRPLPHRLHLPPSSAPGPGAEAGSTTSAFTDFAGSTIVHSTGGWAALAGTRGHRPTARQVRAATAPSDPTPPLQHPCGHPRRLHPLVRLVRLQRRLPARPRQRRRRRLDGHRPRQHQPRGGVRCGRRPHRLEAHPGPHRPLRRAERRHRGPRLHHRRTPTSSTITGPSSSAPSAASSSSSASASSST